MATLNTVASGPVEMLQALVVHLTGDSGTPGRDWTLVEDARDGNGYGFVILGNVGASGSSPIFIGFCLVSAGDGTRYGLCYRVFRSWTAGAGTNFFTCPVGNTFTARESTASSYICCAVALSAGATTVFCQSNKDRIVLVCIYGSRFSSNYIGRFLPWALPGEYPNALACFGDAVYQSYSNSFALCDFQATTIDRYGCIWNPNSYDQGNNGTRVDTTYGYRKCHSVSWPGNTFELAAITNSWDSSGSRRYYTDAPRLLLPVWVSRYFPDANTWTPAKPIGQLDGVFWNPDPQCGAGSTVTVDGENYRVFPELGAMDPNHFIAILED